jgi:hypothetical protein
MKRTRILLAVGLAVLGVALTRGAPNAAADSIYEFDLSFTNLSGVTGPFVHVTINLTDSQHATITFASLTNGGNTYNIGTVAVNVNASDWSVSGISPGSFSDCGSGGGCGTGFDGFGTFNQELTNTDGWADSVTSMQFTLTNDSGTWASASDVLTTGSSAAAHIFPSSFGGYCTGFASNVEGSSPGSTPCTPIPEPATLTLFGTGLLVVAGKVRRRIVKK